MHTKALRLGVFPYMAQHVVPAKSGTVEVDTFEIDADTWQGFGVERNAPRHVCAAPDQWRSRHVRH